MWKVVISGGQIMRELSLSNVHVLYCWKFYNECAQKLVPAFLS